MDKLVSFTKRIIKLIRLDEMSILPGHLAFNIVLMIVPIFSLIGVLGSSIGINQILTSLVNNIPDAVYEIVRSALNTKTSDFNLILFILFSLWIVSGGCRAIITSSNILYKVKDSSSIWNVVKSFLMVIILFLLIAFMIVVPVLGDMIISFLSRIFNENSMLFIANIYHFLKYPFSIILMFIAIKLLYTIAPSVKLKSDYIDLGAWFTTITWFTLTRIYSYHLNNYSNYNVYYGSLSNILILLVWVYLLAYLFVIGMALNADSYLVNQEKNNK